MALPVGLSVRGHRRVSTAIPVIPPQRRTPAGKLAHAGEFISDHTVVAGSQHATPTIDGAIRSGQQAAGALIKRLEGDA